MPYTIDSTTTLGSHQCPLVSVAKEHAQAAQRIAKLVTSSPKNCQVSYKTALKRTHLIYKLLQCKETTAKLIRGIYP